MLRKRRRRRVATSVVSLATLVGAGLLVGAPVAQADVTDEVLTVVVNRDEDLDSTYDSATDPPQPGIEVAVSDASGATVRGITDDEGRFVLSPTKQLKGGPYVVVAAIPPSLSELVPVPSSDSFASFRTTVDLTTTSQTLRLGVASKAPPSPVLPAPNPTAPSSTPTPRPPRFAVGDTVWLDTDRSGVQDPGEPPMPGISVQLLNPDGEVVGTTVSTAAGRFVFDDLPTGTYAVRFAGLPPGFRFAPTRASSNPGTDSDPDYAGSTPPFTLAPGEPGIRPAAAADGVRAAFVNGSIDAGIAPLRYALEGTVWLDADGDGRQRAGEAPAGGEVTLLSGGRVVATAVVDGEGRYRFADLARGEYQVRFVHGEHRRFTERRTGSDPALDSDADPRTGLSQVVTLGPDADDLVPATAGGGTDADLVNATVSAGLVGAYTVGDRVWRDHNGNGVLDPGDDGVRGVRVDLLGEDQRLLDRTTTSSAGTFGFTDLPAGAYRLRFHRPPGTDLVFTAPGRGSNPAVDSDATADGITAELVLDDDNPADPTIDAGLTTRALRDEAPAASGPPPGPTVSTLSSTGGVAVIVPVVGLALVALGVGCLVAGRRSASR